MEQRVRLERDGDIAVIVIDNPPINAGSAAVREGLLAAIATLRGREPQMTPEAAAFTCHELVVDSSRAVRELDYRITPIHRLLGDTIAWMRDEGMLAPR